MSNLSRNLFTLNDKIYLSFDKTENSKCKIENLNCFETNSIYTCYIHVFSVIVLAAIENRAYSFLIQIEGEFYCSVVTKLVLSYSSVFFPFGTNIYYK